MGDTVSGEGAGGPFRDNSQRGVTDIRYITHRSEKSPAVLLRILAQSLDPTDC